MVLYWVLILLLQFSVLLETGLLNTVRLCMLILFGKVLKCCSLLCLPWPIPWFKGITWHPGNCVSHLYVQDTIITVYVAFYVCTFSSRAELNMNVSRQLNLSTRLFLKGCAQLVHVLNPKQGKGYPLHCCSWLIFGAKKCPHKLADLKIFGPIINLLSLLCILM